MCARISRSGSPAAVRSGVVVDDERRTSISAPEQHDLCIISGVFQSPGRILRPHVSSSPVWPEKQALHIPKSRPPMLLTHASLNPRPNSTNARLTSRSKELPHVVNNERRCKRRILVNPLVYTLWAEDANDPVASKSKPYGTYRSKARCM